MLTVWLVLISALPQLLAAPSTTALSLPAELLEDSQLDKSLDGDDGLLRIGRGGSQSFMRLGRGKMDSSFMRLGRASASNFLRLGRGNNAFLRLGRPDNFMRFGRGKNDNFLRFGRDYEEDTGSHFDYDDLTSDGNDGFMGRERRSKKPESNFIRFGRDKNGINFLRLGRSGNSNFLRFGRTKDNFMRFGRSALPDSWESSNGYPEDEVDLFDEEGTVFGRSARSGSTDDEFKNTKALRSSNYIRLGKRSDMGAGDNGNNFIRFGRDVPQMDKGSNPNDSNTAHLESNRSKRSLSGDGEMGMQLPMFSQAIAPLQQSQEKHLGLKLDGIRVPLEAYSPLSAGIPNYILSPELSFLPQSSKREKSNASGSNFLRLG